MHLFATFWQLLVLRAIFLVSSNLLHAFWAISSFLTILRNPNSFQWPCSHISQCFSRYVYACPSKKGAGSPPPGPDHGGWEMHAGGLLGQHSFLRKYKMAHEDSHSTDSSVSSDAVLTHAILGFNYTAKLHKNALTSLHNFVVFWAAFVTKEQLFTFLSDFLKNCRNFLNWKLEQLVESPILPSCILYHYVSEPRLPLLLCVMKDYIH